ncbi:MAG: DNA repair protein RecN [Spirochaetales bacterium]|nr:DNA repair protein RecN [Spirochaetales bacterium]
MLETLDVHNYALIDRLTVRFSKGFNVFTGETGAGKSILIGALGLLLGGKGDPGSIRSGAQETLVSCVVRVNGADREVGEWLAAHDIAPEEGTLILRRTLKKNGRGSIYIQSVPVTQADLKELTALLFDLHGQHDHQSLLVEDNHRKVLDTYAGAEDKALRFRDSFLELKSLKERYQKLVSSERERLRRIDILTHSINEIEEAKLKPKEDEELDVEHKLLANHEKLFALLADIHEHLAESRGGALAALRSTRAAMDDLVEIDPNLSSLKNQLEDAFYELEDYDESIRRVKEETRFDPDRLSAVESRLGEIRLLKKKYGNTIEEILAYADESRRELASIENWEEDKESLQKDIAAREKSLLAAAEELTAIRTRAAEALERKIVEELKALSMPKVRFKVGVKDKKNDGGKPVVGVWGKDEVEFIISPNLGEPFKKLKSIASGGELSRVMLAVKTALAEADNIGSLIFDEIDAGIGGEVALTLGERLAQLSRYKQVLCITHLATIAVRADNHIKVEKSVEGGRTYTRVKPVGGRERVEEIARMLAGDKRQEVSIKHAEELIAQYGSRAR